MLTGVRPESGIDFRIAEALLSVAGGSLLRLPTRARARASSPPLSKRAFLSRAMDRVIT